MTIKASNFIIEFKYDFAFINICYNCFHNWALKMDWDSANDLTTKTYL